MAYTMCNYLYTGAQVASRHIRGSGTRELTIMVGGGRL
eukprot:CAMPEP_0172869292 /NCGR_PEP_ID=MMETSP1075-20121228/88622_1 /TAXON_ID=2916 /ORGANISM="Ceratium fusus, Strain PA161109" /LENGTH=37 /DNA_ID= /DNA_START= /DNA_END= /DNA_ORIENTATION=